LKLNKFNLSALSPAILGLTLPFSIILSNYLFALVMILLIFTSVRRKTVAWIPMMIMAIPCLIPVFSIIFHGETFYWTQLEVRIPFLITALVVGVFNIDEDILGELKRGLILGTLLAAAMFFINQSWLNGVLNNYNLFDLAYIPLFAVVSLILLWYTNVQIQNRVKIVLSIGLLGALLLLGQPFFVVSGLLVGISAIIVKGSRQQSRIGVMLVVVLGALMLYQGNQINNYLEQQQPTHMSPQNKLAQWQCVLEVMAGRELFGVGYAGKNDLLIDCYHQHNMTEAEANSFNSHNEYLDFLLTLGYLGVIALLVYFINALFVAYDKKQVALLLIIILISLFALTENVFTRQKGVMLTSLTYLLIYVSKDISGKEVEETDTVTKTT
jgi:hypothetical protein